MQYDSTDILSQRARAEINRLRADAYHNLEMADLLNDLQQQLDKQHSDIQKLSAENNNLRTLNQRLLSENSLLKQQHPVINNFNGNIDTVNISAKDTPSPEQIIMSIPNSKTV